MHGQPNIKTEFGVSNKKNWSDVPCIDIKLMCDYSVSHNGAQSALQGFYTSPTGKY